MEKTDRERIAEVEKFLDNFNVNHGDTDNLCLFCHATEYNGQSGIVHTHDCVIISLRLLLAGRKGKYDMRKIEDVSLLISRFLQNFDNQAHEYPVGILAFQICKLFSEARE